MNMEDGIPTLPASTRGMDYTYSRRSINNVVKLLRDIGTEEIIKLPKIAVVGNQSAGKSSLIEAISQVRLPRTSGTCTKCPMEVFLSSSGSPEEWKAKVLLRLERETVVFDETTNRDDITLLLQRAQLAILNPDKPLAEFQTLPKERCSNNYQSSQMFSRNTVVLEITGADVDVTFIDLPGVIQNPPPGGGNELVDLVRDMVNSYVSEADCLILLVVAMTDDIENQAAPRFAKHYDKEGQRTLGVITKADLVPPENYEYWTKIIKNEIHPLKHGYYITRLSFPNGVYDHQEIREREREFFRETHPIWKEASSRRLGSEKLTDALSRRLHRLIEARQDLQDMRLMNRLPQFTVSLAAKKREYEDKLKALPQTFEDGAQVVLNGKCTEYIMDIDCHLKGHDPDLRYYSDLRDYLEVFKREIEGTKPKIESNSYVRGEVPGISVRLVRDLIRTKRVKELPAVVPHAVYEALVNTFVSKWRGKCLTWFNGFEKYALQFVTVLCEKHFGAFKASGLYDHARLVTEEILSNIMKEISGMIQFFCHMEERRSFVLMEEDYNKTRETIDSDSYSDGADTESVVIANVRAYFDVSSKRLIEVIPMICDTALSLKLYKQLNDSFSSKLGILGDSGSKNSEKYLREDPDIRERRLKLRRKLEIVNQAEQILASINN